MTKIKVFTSSCYYLVSNKRSIVSLARQTFVFVIHHDSQSSEYRKCIPDVLKYYIRSIDIAT